MSGRPTADIAASLLADVHTNCTFDKPCPICANQVDAAHRLTELARARPSPIETKELVAVIQHTRLRWERYVADCNPVDELDEQGRTLDRAIAERVRAYFAELGHT